MDLQTSFRPYRALEFRHSFARRDIPRWSRICWEAFVRTRHRLKSGASWGKESIAVQLREARSLYSRPHLPQGVPTSPALANGCAYRVDCRLRALARSAGAEYTRYADDLAFSGEKLSRSV